MNENGRFPAQIDFDLHGFVGVRLMDAYPSDVKVVTRQLGPIQKSFEREPDILIRFVDHLPISSQIRFIGLNDAGFTDDAFLVLRSKYRSRVVVQISFEKIGERCEIICERGLPAIPLLIAIVNLTALNKGILPLHASAFTYKNKGVLATGWAKGGKTETLLAFMERGAQYVGDEWVYLSEDGQKMYGIPEPIRIWDWHLRDVPVYQAKVARSDRVRLRGLNVLISTMDKAISSGVGERTAPAKLMRRMSPVLRRQLYVQMPPGKLFGQQFCALEGSPDVVFFLASHESDETIVRPVKAEEIARRMIFSLQQESLEFFSYYQKFRFAFPGASNELIEKAEEIQKGLLLKTLAAKEAYTVLHPYPVPIPALYDSISPLVR